MSRGEGFWKSGHPATLIMSFLYFDVSFMVWLVNAAMAPFITEQFGLSPAETGLMLAIPLFAGGFLRIPLGLVAEMIGRRAAALMGMGMTIAALLFGWQFATSYTNVLILGALLGVAGASFAVALPLGSGWYPAKYQGLAMGIAGAGNSGTVLAALLAPPLALAYGFMPVYGMAAVPVLIVMVLMYAIAKEPPDKVPRKKIVDYLHILAEKDTAIFSWLYWWTFGGFVGFAAFMPTFMVSQYGFDKVTAGQFMMVIGVTASAVRVLGGYLGDKLGGIRALIGIFLLMIAGTLVVAPLPASPLITVIGFFIMAIGMGAGNGAIFQLIPFRFYDAKAIASGVVGEVGALGGAMTPLVMGYSVQLTGTFSLGFLLFAVGSASAIGLLLISRKRWTSTWIGEHGKAPTPTEPTEQLVPEVRESQPAA